jgi:hypothetical protein
LSRISGCEPLVSLVFVTAKTRPSASALRLTWSSLFQPVGTSSSAQAPSPAPSRWIANVVRWSTSLSYITPIRSPPKRTTAEMSSESSPGLPGMTNGAPQAASSPPAVWLTYTREPCVQVAHSVPVESRSMLSASAVALLMAAGKPGSSV